MTLTLQRPAIIESDEQRVTAECSSARWTHHRLLDFEDLHQRVLDAAAEAAAPGIVRVGRVLAKLARRARRAERSSEGSWCPNPRPDLAARLRARLGELRRVRDADPRWRAALGWADEQVGEPKQVRRRRAKPPEKVRRRKTETDEAYRKRFELLTSDETDEHYAAKLEKAARQTRREAYRARLYAERRIYWATWNALCRSVDQARSDVLRRRRNGLPAEWRRPKYRDPVSLAADAGGFRIVDREGLWWRIEMRVGVASEWVRFRAKGGSWHAVPDDAVFRTAKLTRRKDGERWNYSVSLVVEGVQKKSTAARGSEYRDDWGHREQGIVAFDWGHREHGHDREEEGIRAFTWLGDDGATGEVLIPAECRRLLDEIDALKSRADTTYDARRAARGLPEKNRHLYRRRLMRSGVRDEEESLWLRWEMKYERRMAARRKRVQNLRRETYLRAVRELRARYATFVFEAERIHDAVEDGPTIRKLETEDQMPRRRRANRDLATRYEFLSICERFGAEILTVPSRNTTRECPEPGCDGLLPVNGPELIVACPACGTVRDKDRGAAVVILRRGQEALAKDAAE